MANTHVLQSAVAGDDEGLIVTPHPLASEAGSDVLRQGGTAAEAVVAAGAVLTVVCPHFCGLGGDGVWMVADREGRRSCILGLGHAAANCVGTGTALPVRGGGAASTTAGLVAGWRALLAWQAGEWGGSRDASELLGPAEDLARNGYPVSAQQVFWTGFRIAEFAEWGDLSAVFLVDGALPPVGHGLRQGRLADTLSSLRRHGLDAFYSGPLAARIAEGLAAAGSPLRAGDLDATVATVEPPETLQLGEVTLLAPPPPTQGITTLSIMAILGRFPGLGRAGEVQRMHLQVEAVKQAFLRRDAIADPRFASEPARAATGAEIEAWAAGIDPGRASPWGEDFRRGDTVFLAATDRNGRHVSALQSTYFDWGAGIIAGDTGVIWNNRGAAFSSDARSPNCILPGKRPFHTLNPGIAQWGDGRTLLYGTQGADGQPQTLAVLLSEIIFRNLDPVGALSAPRFLLGRTFSDANASLKVERDVGRDTLVRLAALGHEVAELPPLSPLAGQAGLILVEADGRKSGAHDPRGDGVAAVG